MYDPNPNYSGGLAPSSSSSSFGQGGGSRQHSIPLEILDDLASRFIINAPEGEKSDLIRMCFQIELAHWFYIDEYVGSEPKSNKLRTCNMREFAEHMFRHISFLRGYADGLDEIMDDWRNYKLAVPTYGAIILDDDLSHVLIVQGFWSKNSWGFPKGKVNEEEEPHQCAVREVYEETGFDISEIIHPDQYLEAVINDQTVWLYLIPGVPRDTKFQPRTKNEIRDLRWFCVADLPNNKKEQMRPNALNLTPNNLYMVLPFVKSLRKWISRGQFKRTRTDSVNSTQQKKTRRTSSSKSKDSTPVVQAKVERKPASGGNGVDGSLEYPRIWPNFRFQQNEVLLAMTSTPGWI